LGGSNRDNIYDIIYGHNINNNNFINFMSTQDGGIFKSKLNIFDLVEEVETLKATIKEKDLLIDDLKKQIQELNFYY
jgi:hypothetical protein